MFSSTVYLVPLLVSLIGVSYIGHAYGEMDCNKLNPFDVNKENIGMSKGSLPIRINLTSNVYGNQETIKVNIGDALNSRFSVQIRSADTNQRVGKFQSWPNSVLQPLFCEGSNQSILTTTQPLNSSDVSFYWQPPRSDKGTLALMGTFINGGKYWTVKKDGPKIFYHLPRRKKEIPISLLCHGADVLCVGDECGYQIVYELVDNQNLKIELTGVNIKNNVSLAVAVTRNKELDDSIIMMCTLNPELGIKVKGYLSMKEKDGVIVSRTVDYPGENSFKCNALVSLKALKGKGGESLKYAHFWGKIEENNGVLILPKNKRVGNLFRPLLKEDTVNISCYRSLNQANVSSNADFHKFLAIYIGFMIICLSFYC